MITRIYGGVRITNFLIIMINPLTFYGVDRKQI